MRTLQVLRWKMLS